MLKNDKILAFGGTENNPDYLNNIIPAEIFETKEIEKDNGRVYTILNNGIEGDIICSNHTFLTDGNYL